ncbi:LytS family sensor histidine kinase [Sphingobacterium faecale]|uniref:Histidine kinase n=1 Tax=Sphingobacterium faecale TaxID=2803775 RepID=A0ABS1R6U2_9SPHI|nr:hypothetical protein [Sphingobacterium faecale]MBL1410373.1 hypothetical protein [Sphingobacterium faecale]
MNTKPFYIEKYKHHFTILFWTLIWILLSWVNFDFYSGISFFLSIFIVLLYVAFGYTISYGIDWFIIKRRALWILAFIGILFPIALLVVYFWIYHIMPKFGLYAFKRGAAFDFEEFLTTIGTEYGKLLLFYVTPIWLFGSLVRTLHSWQSYRRGFGLLNEQVKRSRMSMHLERNTLSFILYVTRIGQSVHTATLLEMYLDVKVYIEEVSQLSLPFKPIKTEMAYVEKMLDFYCLRYRRQDAVRLQVAGRYSGQIIPALVLLTIIENIGTYADLTCSAAVRIELELHDDGYTFRSWNIKKTGAIAITEPTGRGMQFVHEQLDTHLAGKYDLQVEDLETTYQLELNVNLNSEQHARDNEESTTAG